MSIRHGARLSPLQPETVWTLEAGTLVETRGRAERRFPLTDLKRYRLAVGRDGRRRSLLLTFGRRRIVIVSQSYQAPGKFEDRLASFSTLARAIAAIGADLSPRARFGVARIEARAALTGMIALTTFGAAATFMFSVSVGMAAVGVDMTARMVFALLLLLAALPWIGPGRAFDPRDPPADLLP